MLSSSMAYWFPLLNSSSTIVDRCSESESKNRVLGWMACFTACKMVSMLTTSSWRIVAPKHYIKSLIDSDHPIRTWNKSLCFILTEHMY